MRCAHSGWIQERRLNWRAWSVAAVRLLRHFWKMRVTRFSTVFNDTKSSTAISSACRPAATVFEGLGLRPGMGGDELAAMRTTVLRTSTGTSRSIDDAGPCRIAEASYVVLGCRPPHSSSRNPRV